MDIEKLIERLGENTDCWTDKVHGYADLRLKAATALSTLQAENEELRAELEQVKQELDEAVEYLRGQCRYCKRNFVCTSRKGPHSNCWEWRGQKKD